MFRVQKWDWLFFCVPFALTVALGFAARADVEEWTDKGKVTVKGTLKEIRVQPSSGAQQTQPKARSEAERKRKNLSGSKQASKRLPVTLRVGPKQRLKWPSLAALKAQDGDTIEIEAGEYVDCSIWMADNLTIRGVGGRAHVRDETCKGKAIWVINGNNTTIENIEFSGMRVRNENGAGIRHQGAGLTIRNSYFHDGQQGILGGGQKPGDVILIEDSEFARLGLKGRAHPIYINKAEKFTFRRNFVHGCLDEANCVKTRAKHSVITCNIIASLDSPSSWELDFPNGGFVEVRDNVIEQGPKSVNRNIIGFAMETRKAKRRNSQQTLIVEGNTIINDHTSGEFVSVIMRGNTKVKVEGNKIVGPGRLYYKENNKLFHRRHIANIKPYPALPLACE